MPTFACIRSDHRQTTKRFARRTASACNEQPTSIFSSRFGHCLVNNRLNLCTLFLVFCVLVRHVSASTLAERSEAIRSEQPGNALDVAINRERIEPAGFDLLVQNTLALENAIPELGKRQAQTPTSSFPVPFDGGLGNNFTSSSCPLFFNDFLNDPNFQACHAVSLLLVVSLL